MPASSVENDSTDPIRVFIVDDHPPIREAVVEIVEQTTDIEVCGTTGSADEAFRQVERLQPDVAVVDIVLADGHGLDLVENVRAQHPDVQVIVFSMYDEDMYAERAIRAGASSYLMKSEPTEKIVEAIRTVESREVFLSDRLSSQLLQKVAFSDSPEPTFDVDQLSDREMQVFQLLGQGHTLEEIQDQLALSRKTVETYRRRAKDKLGLDSVSDLLRYAVHWTHESGAHGREEASDGREHAAV